MGNLGEDLPDDVIHAMIDKIDVDGDGRVSFEGKLPLSVKRFPSFITVRRDFAKLFAIVTTYVTPNDTQGRTSRNYFLYLTLVYEYKFPRTKVLVLAEQPSTLWGNFCPGW